MFSFSFEVLISALEKNFLQCVELSLLLQVKISHVLLLPWLHVCCLPCNHCSNWTWVVEEILAFGNRLRSTYCREFNYLKLCRPAHFVRTTQLCIIETAVHCSDQFLRSLPRSARARVDGSPTTGSESSRTSSNATRKLT